MGYLLHVARKDLGRYAKDRLALAMYLGIPLLIGGLITLLMGGSGGIKPRPHLMIADQDDTFFSQLLVQALSGGPGPGDDSSEESFLRVEAVEAETGRARLMDDEASALLVLPAGFAHAWLHEEPTELQLLTNPAQRILPGILEGTLEIFVDGTFYLQRLAGEELRSMFTDADPDGAAEGAGFAAGLKPDVEVARIATSINGIMHRIEKYAMPPVFDLHVENEEERAAALKAEAAADTTIDAGAEALPESTPARTNPAVLFLPGIILMALFFGAQGLSEDMWKERQLGTLQRALAAPGDLRLFYAGKLCAGTVVICALCAAGLAIGFAYHGLDAGLFPLALAWSTLSGMAFLALMCWLQTCASSQRAGSILTNTLLFPLLMIGGSFFPFEMMPAWMGAVGRFTPNGSALEVLKDIVMDRADVARLCTAFATALVLLSLLFLAGARRLTHGFATKVGS